MQKMTSLKCDYCLNISTKELLRGYDLNDREIKICDDCSNGDDFFTCEDCDKVCHNNNHRDVNGGICSSCLSENYTSCGRCDEYVYNDDSYLCEPCDTYYCEYCYNDRHGSACENYNEEPNTRHYSTSSTAFLSDKEGNTVKSTRIFSAEVECYYPDIDTHNDTLATIPTPFGASTDGSLNNDGIEFQTPLLSGVKGEKAMQDFLKTLNDNNYYTDKACGLHTHIDGKGYAGNPRAIANLMVFYILFEDVLLSFLPRSRRTNNYCRLLRKDYHLAEIKKTQDLDSLEQLWYRTEDTAEIERLKEDNKSSSTRYYGINFHCLLAEGHIEIRYHSGTINAKKILEWINLHCRILDSVLLAPLGDGFIADIMSETDIEAKTDMLFSYLQLSPDSISYFKDRQAKFKGVELPEIEYEPIVLPSMARGVIMSEANNN